MDPQHRPKNLTSGDRFCEKRAYIQCAAHDRIETYLAIFSQSGEWPLCEFGLVKLCGTFGVDSLQLRQFFDAHFIESRFEFLRGKTLSKGTCKQRLLCFRCEPAFGGIAV